MAASWCSKSQNNKTLRKLDVNFQKGKYLCSFLDCSLSLSFHFPLLASNQPLFTMPHPTLVTTSTTTFSRSQVQVLYFRFRSWSVTWFEYEPTNMFEYVSLVGAHPRPFPFRNEKKRIVIILLGAITLSKEREIQLQLGAVLLKRFFVKGPNIGLSTATRGSIIFYLPCLHLHFISFAKCSPNIEEEKVSVYCCSEWQDLFGTKW